MSAPKTARFEIVRTEAGWHARILAGNGQVVWTTEVYTGRRAAVRAVEFIVGRAIYRSPHAAHPEVDWTGNREVPTEVRDVDERGAS